MNENLYLSPLSYAESARLMLELRNDRPEARVITLPSRMNEPMHNKPRKAKRLVDQAGKEKWEKNRAEQKLAADARARIKAQRKLEAKLQKEAEQEERRAAREMKAKNTISKLVPAPDGRTGGVREIYLKPLPPKHFEPVIGAVNADGETPVRIDAKTVILVGAGKDIQKVIAKYQKLLNIK
jgi:hypothetical protein